MADSKLSALSLASVPGASDLLYGEVGGASKAYQTDYLFGLLDFFGGRLTTETGVPVSTSDRTAQGTIYLTPNQALNSGLYRIYDGTRWRYYKNTSDISLALTATSGKNYDWFLRWNAGTPALALSSAWTDDSTRADALALQDGIPVLSSDHTYRWGGTLRASGTNVTEDSKRNRFGWNLYNQIELQMQSTEVSDSHTDSTASWQEWHAGTNSQRLSWVNGAPVAMSAGGTFQLYATAQGTYGFLGVGLDVTSAVIFSAFGNGLFVSGTVGVRGASGGRLPIVATGYHQIIPLEFGNATNPPGMQVFQIYASVMG